MPRVHYPSDQWKLLRARAVGALLDLIGVFAVSDLCRLVGLEPWSVRQGHPYPHGVIIHPAGLIISILAVFAWFVVPEVILGATVGKRLMHLRVYSTTGAASTTQVLVRNLARIVDFPLLYLVGGLVASLNPKGRRIGDVLARTHVAFDL